MAGKIVTVLGETPPEKLGFCHSHEHLWIAPGESGRINPALRIDDEALSLAELADFYAVGGRAVADAQPVGCGRDPEVLARLSRDSGVHIMAATGFHKLLFYPEGHWLRAMSRSQLADLFTGELLEGMFALCDDSPPRRRCPHRAGFIKTALDVRWTPQYETLFAAAAEASIRTGAPLMAHIEPGGDPVALADFLEGQGLPLSRALFCHMDRAVADLSVHESLCRRGVWLEYDTISREKYHDDNREAAIIAHMVSAGWGHRILLGLDVTRERMVRYGGSVGLPYIAGSFLPLLAKSGIPPEVSGGFCGGNPARAFGWGK